MNTPEGLRQVRRATYLAASAFVLAIILAAVSLGLSARVARQARADAVAEAGRAQAAALRGTCNMYGVFYDATFREDLRALLRVAYVDAGCVPPIETRTPLPSPTPTR